MKLFGSRATSSFSCFQVFSWDCTTRWKMQLIAGTKDEMELFFGERAIKTFSFNVGVMSSWRWWKLWKFFVVPTLMDTLSWINQQKIYCWCFKIVQALKSIYLMFHKTFNSKRVTERYVWALDYHFRWILEQWGEGTRKHHHYCMRRADRLENTKISISNPISGVEHAI